MGAARKVNIASSSRKANGSSKRQCSCQFWKYQPIKARQLQNLARFRVTLDRFWHRYDPDIHAFLQRWLLRRSAEICVGAWRCQCIVTSHFQCQRVCFESQIGAYLVDGTYCARYVRIEEAVSQVLLTKAPSGQTTGVTKWQALVLRRVTLRFVERSWLTNTCTQTGSYEKPFFFVRLLADKLFIVLWYIKPCHIRVFISFASTCSDHLRALRGWLIKTLIAQTMTELWRK